MSVAGVLLSLEASVFGILELDYKSLWPPICSFFHIDKHPSAAVGQPIQGIDVVDKDDFTPDLQLQHSLEGRVPDAASIVDLECFDEPACIFGLDCEKFSINVVQLGIVPGIDFGIGAVDVEGIGVNVESL